MKIGIDFDGVLIKHPGIPKHDWADFNDPPMENAREIIQHLIEEEHEIYVFTSRPKKEWPKIAEWLDTYKFPVMEITNIKRPASMYIDDRAIRFTNWQDIRKLLT